MPDTIPPSVRSASLDSLERDLDALRTPGLAKTRPTGLVHAADNEPARARFVACVDALRKLDWSWEKIARHLGIRRTSVVGVYFGHRYVTGWQLDKLEALPELEHLATKIRVAQLRKVG